MPDKLDWLNEHFVLMKHRTVQEVTVNSHYKIPFEQRELAKQNPLAEDYLKKLAEQELFPLASDFLAFNIHQRALAWWAYCCVLSVEKELLEKPHKPVDISEIGVRKKPEIPDWAKMPEEKPVDYKSNPDYIRLQNDLSNIKMNTERLIQQLPPGIWEKHLALRKQVYAEFKKVVGKDPDELMADALEQVDKIKALKDESEAKAPIYKMKKELEEKIEKIRKETVAQIKAAVTEKSPAEIKEQTGEAMDAVYACITAPTDENAQACLNAGNACPETPEGLTALIAFWSYGNLTPKMDQVVKTPPELAPNGMKGLLLKCALAPGGTRKFQERMKLYFEIGREVGFGKNNWSEFMKDRVPPHKKPGLSEFDGLLGKKAPANPQPVAETPESVSEKSAAAPKFERFKG
ncbi:MAG: hypothetical protein VZR11_07950 [Succinimonas sp.]|nr:hypothetical protein [Succinimonas sp.]